MGSGALFLRQQDDFSQHFGMLDEFVRAMGFAQGQALGNVGMNLLFSKQSEKMSKIFGKPFGMFFLLGGDGVPACGFAIGKRA